VQVFFGRSMNEERLITVRLEEHCSSSWISQVLQSANYVRTELPVRIAHRIRDLQSLPYVVVTQEGLAKVTDFLGWTCLRF
jgi:pyruvate dehydrogenase kinase 2/3/4